ncbi:MAG: class B sortase [Clostridiales bacterium]|jgi:SrtB family sortase|nr:class B sortase [Clostridiales bacterium]
MKNRYPHSHNIFIRAENIYGDIFIEDDFDMDSFNRRYARDEDKPFFRRVTRAVFLALVTLSACAATVLLYVLINDLLEGGASFLIEETELTSGETEYAFGGITDFGDETAADGDEMITGNGEAIIHVTGPRNEAIASLATLYDNDEIIGMLMARGAEINYVVARGSDNEFYLNHDIAKKPSSSGALFMDSGASVYPLDKNTIIYGNSATPGVMFDHLKRFEDGAYFESHKEIVFETLYENTRWEVFAFVSSDISPDAGSYESGVKALASEVKSRAKHKTDADISDDDRILTLRSVSQDGPSMSLYARMISSDGVK